jgi:hypothetical protein
MMDEGQRVRDWKDGGGCSPVRTCLSLHFSEMQGDFAKMQGDRERMPAKSDQISAA